MKKFLRTLVTVVLMVLMLCTSTTVAIAANATNLVETDLTDVSAVLEFLGYNITSYRDTDISMNNYTRISQPADKEITIWFGENGQYQVFFGERIPNAVKKYNPKVFYRSDISVEEWENLIINSYATKLSEEAQALLNSATTPVEEQPKSFMDILGEIGIVIKSYIWLILGVIVCVILCKFVKWMAKKFETVRKWIPKAMPEKCFVKKYQKYLKKNMVNDMFNRGVLKAMLVAYEKLENPGKVLKNLDADEKRILWELISQNPEIFKVNALGEDENPPEPRSTRMLRRRSRSFLSI